VLEVFPGAQAALFRRYHIGGCASCGFQPTENPRSSLPAQQQPECEPKSSNHIRTSHEQDANILIEPKKLAEMLQQDKSVRLVDVRSRKSSSRCMSKARFCLSQPVMQRSWRRHQCASVVIIDHTGKNALDARPISWGTA